MVLLVHHREPVRRVLAAALQVLGRPVISTASAEQALALLEDSRHSFQLLITANLLTGMNGPELARRFRTAAGPTAPVIMLSAYERPPEGASDAFFWEPADVDEITRKAAQLMDMAVPAGSDWPRS